MDNGNYLRFKDLEIGDTFIVVPYSAKIDLNTAPIFIKTMEGYVDGYGNLNAADIRYGGEDHISDELEVIRVKQIDGEQRWKVCK